MAYRVPYVCTGYTLKCNIVMKLTALHQIDAAHALSLADTMLTGGGGRQKRHTASDAVSLVILYTFYYFKLKLE